MLDISFYPKNSKNSPEPISVEVSDELYEWLAKSEFSKIGKSVSRKIQIDDEEQTLSVVQLTPNNRKKLREFFVESISTESEQMLSKLGDSPSKQEYQQASYCLNKLHELRKCVENEQFSYLVRA